ncbi:MAG: MerR family transcriptional regulator [Gammaproteobacteria bacterium]
MSSPRSHSLAELVEATSFDRRTIVYYIQSGLLPKVGRRGPHTRYPDECLTRLLFIKGVRNLQTEGQLLTATLAEMRRALAVREAAGIRDLLDRGLPVAELTALFAEEAAPPAPPAPPVAAPPAASGPTGERRSYGLADAGIRKRLGPDRPATPGTPESHHDDTHPGLPALDPATAQPAAPAIHTTGSTESAVADTELGELLRELEVRPTLSARRNPPGSAEQWTEIPITSRVYLSVRGLAAEDAPLAEAVGRLLKRALRARSSPTAT